MFNPDNTVMDELIDHKFMLMEPARSYLARFLFRGEDVFKRVSMLSGGERARLALAILALEDANFLLLDEPTNHLDIPAQEALQEVLENFGGTILLVSHDRYLIDRLATQIWALDDGYLHVFEGPYTEYVAAREAAKGEKREETVDACKPSWEELRAERARKNQERKRAQAVAEMEGRIHALEADLAHLEQSMAAASQQQNLDELHRLSDRYAETQRTLEQFMDEWMALAEA
jgi:ATP-binding cassette subfamily F protein 3